MVATESYGNEGLESQITVEPCEGISLHRIRQNLTERCGQFLACWRSVEIGISSLQQIPSQRIPVTEELLDETLSCSFSPSINAFDTKGLKTQKREKSGRN